MVEPLSYLSFHAVFHDLYDKGRGMCYPICEMMHIKQSLFCRKRVAKVVVAAGFLSGYLNDHLDVRPSITVNKMC